MRSKTIIGRISLMTFMLIVFSLVLLPPSAFANNSLEVVGGENGLEVIPHDENLFNEFNLAPGDTLEGKLTIRNNDQNTFALFLRAETLNDGLFDGLFNKTPDLSEKLLMEVRLRDDILYEGPMNAFAVGDGIPLGNFEPGEVQELDIQIHLPGATTGNEYMGLSVKNQWVLTAQSEETVIIEDEDPPLGPGEIPDEDSVIIEDEEVPIGEAKLPKTGGTPAVLFFIAGAAIVSAGVVLKKKGSTNNNLGPNKFK